MHTCSLGSTKVPSPTWVIGPSLPDAVSLKRCDTAAHLSHAFIIHVLIIYVLIAAHILFLLHFTLATLQAFSACCDNIYGNRVTDLSVAAQILLLRFTLAALQSPLHIVMTGTHLLLRADSKH